MAGYSTTGASKKLGVSPGTQLWLVHSPPRWVPGDLPAEVEVHRRAPASAGDVRSKAVVVAFYRAAAEYLAEVPVLADRIFPDASLWAAWPRKAAGHISDLSDNVVRAAGLELGLVDNKVAAIDEDWSGLRLVWRLEHRGRDRPLGA